MTVAATESCLLMTPPSSRQGGRARPPTNRVSGPKYDLEEVRRVANLASITKFKATRRVVNRLGVGEPEAEAFIRKKLRELEQGDYFETVEMDWDPAVTADVYGKVDEHGGWYIKFFVEHGRVQVCSFHEPEHDFTCANGVVVKGE